MLESMRKKTWARLSFFARHTHGCIFRLEVNLQKTYERIFLILDFFCSIEAKDESVGSVLHASDAQITISDFLGAI